MLTYDQAQQQQQQPGYGSPQTPPTHPPGYGAASVPSSQKYPPSSPASYPPAPEPSGYGSSSSAGGGAPWSYEGQEDAQQSGQSSSEGDDQAAYRTWDFLLLAKSRLQRLGDSVDWASSDSGDWSTSGQGTGGAYYSNDASDATKSTDTGYDVATGYDHNTASGTVWLILRYCDKLKL